MNKKAKEGQICSLLEQEHLPCPWTSVFLVFTFGLGLTALAPLILGASLVAHTVKNLPATQETWVQSLDGEDPLEEEMATHSNILAWKIAWTEEPGGLQSIKSQRVRHD